MARTSTLAATAIGALAVLSGSVVAQEQTIERPFVSQADCSTDDPDFFTLVRPVAKGVPEDELDPDVRYPGGFTKNYACYYRLPNNIPWLYRDTELAVTWPKGKATVRFACTLTREVEYNLDTELRDFDTQIIVEGGICGGSFESSEDVHAVPVFDDFSTGATQLSAASASTTTCAAESQAPAYAAGAAVGAAAVAVVGAAGLAVRARNQAKQQAAEDLARVTV